MELQILKSVSGLVPFSIYFGSALGLLLVFAGIYGLITPYNEHALIRDGKTAPAITMGGALLGFALPMASAIAHSVSLIDMLIWSVVAIVIQVLAFLFLRLCFKHLVQDVAEDKVGPAIFLALFSIVVGLLNAACMTY